MHRRIAAFVGERAETRTAALAFLSQVPPGHTLWVGPEDTHPAKVRRLLGTEVYAVVLDLHDGVEADLLGQAEGLIVGGGALVLRLPFGRPPPSPQRLAASGASTRPVRSLFGARLVAGLTPQDPRSTPPLPPCPSPGPLDTREQDAVVRVLCGTLACRGAAVVVADRGRGKSTALGRAVRHRPGRSVVVGLDAGAHHRLRAAGPPGLEARTPAAFLAEGASWDTVLVDEAARIAVPVLKKVATAASTSALVFASTTRGYEGTGRGFSLRFLPWLEQQRPVTTLALRVPIRWSEGDPVEAWLRDRLCLAAQSPTPDPDTPTRFVRLPPERLAAQPSLLEGVFALLVGAHYRTTPGDLQRLLDAPSLHLFAALDEQDRPLAANLVSIEGGLEEAACRRFRSGQTRMAGHALADSLVVHLGRAEAGSLRMMRSVRLATHPAARRRGLATRLIQTAEDWARTEERVVLFGTLFGAEPGVLQFRAAAGYELARVGGSFGARTGAPSALMLRAATPEAAPLVATLRNELNWSLPVQLDLLAAEADLGLDPALREALVRLGPHQGPPPSRQACREAIEGALNGPRTVDSIQWALERLLPDVGATTPLSAQDTLLLQTRILQRSSWEAARKAADLPSIRATQRRLKQALRRLFSE